LNQVECDADQSTINDTNLDEQQVLLVWHVVPPVVVVVGLENDARKQTAALEGINKMKVPHKCDYDNAKSTLQHPMHNSP
jgi:hypothetical protein